MKAPSSPGRLATDSVDNADMAPATMESRRAKEEAAFIRAADVRREPVEWLWNERIPHGMISLVAGPPGYATAEESLRKTAPIMDMESVTVQGKKASDHVFTWERIDKCSHERFGPVIATWMDGLKAALCEDCNLLVWYEGARPELPKRGDHRTKLEKRSKA